MHRIRIGPEYAKFYYANKNINPRLPPPITSRGGSTSNPWADMDTPQQVKRDPHRETKCQQQRSLPSTAMRSLQTEFPKRRSVVFIPISPPLRRRPKMMLMPSPLRTASCSVDSLAFRCATSCASENASMCQAAEWLHIRLVCPHLFPKELEVLYNMLWLSCWCHLDLMLCPSTHNKFMLVLDRSGYGVCVFGETVSHSVCLKA